MGPDAALVPDLIATRRPLAQPWGVRHVWIIDPAARTAWMLAPESPKGIWIHSDGSLIDGDQTEIALADLFNEVDKLLPA